MIKQYSKTIATEGLPKFCHLSWDDARPKQRQHTTLLSSDINACQQDSFFFSFQMIKPHSLP